MKAKRNTQHNESITTSAGARPMKTHIDQNGNEWLCDAGVNPKEDFSSQGCWRTDMMAFNRND